MILAAPIGKGRDGREVVADIHALPHLLIAGMVGSGKTVLIHNILTSLISENDPGRLRLIQHFKHEGAYKRHQVEYSGASRLSGGLGVGLPFCPWKRGR
jgi:FtsK/SpoIIIE family